VTRQPASVIRLRLYGAAAGIAALAGRGWVPDRSAPNWRDMSPDGSLALSVRAGESG
jgi:hypothetical protein